MAPRKWRIEIVCDYDVREKVETTDAIVRTHAKQLLTQAMLLQDRRPPQIMVESGDNFTTSQEIMLVEDTPDAPEEAEAKEAEGAKTANATWARGQGYTVKDKGTGWKFNDPDGKWSEQSYTTEAAAWEAAYLRCAAPMNHIEQ